MTEFHLERLKPTDAPAICACFERVYGKSYANELFYQPQRLQERIALGLQNCVGAITPDRTVIGHMAMTTRPDAASIELGNTVVDLQLRGQGIAWKVGAELTNWARELGYTGYLHYPTTDHHVMQRQSVKSGFETGLMLGYIPADTDGKVNDENNKRAGLRQAATIVYEPFEFDSPVAVHLPERFADAVEEMRYAIGLRRIWVTPVQSMASLSQYSTETFERRGLTRLIIISAASDVADVIETFSKQAGHCLQIDFHMSDAGIDLGIASAVDAGFYFCGWLPGFDQSDVLRMQKVDPGLTDMQPNVVNPTAQLLLQVMRVASQASEA